MVFTKANNELDDMKTAADTQISFEMPSMPLKPHSEQELDQHFEMPATPVLPYTPLFPVSSSSSNSLCFSDLSTPEETFADSFSSQSIYHSTFSSFTGPPTPGPIASGLGISGLTRKDGSPLDGLGLIGFSSSPWRPRITDDSDLSPSLPSQTFLNEILYTFTADEADISTSTSSNPLESETSYVDPEQPIIHCQRKGKPTLTRNLSAPTRSSSLKQSSRPRSDSCSSVPWR
ncbi:hypothetical protein V5O48_010138 [Marasmius crinis-equi]|uniref:Uncharacterized protein n=1 Tax=Marasmius crinis-equi TaxID=585013 RepID=A0ABR3F9C8_9AGAR